MMIFHSFGTLHTDSAFYMIVKVSRYIYAQYDAINKHLHIIATYIHDIDDYNMLK